MKADGEDASRCSLARALEDLATCAEIQDEPHAVIERLRLTRDDVLAAVEPVRLRGVAQESAALFALLVALRDP